MPMIAKSLGLSLLALMALDHGQAQAASQSLPPEIEHAVAAPVFGKLAATPLARRSTAIPTSPSPRFTLADALRTDGVVRTSVERSFSGAAVASLGFLCGLQPSYYSSGVAGAAGYDPNGRFIGAKLAFPIR